MSETPQPQQGGEEAIQSLVQEVNTDDCWLWAGWTDRKDYGRLYGHSKYRDYRAHRVVYEYEVGEIPEGLVLDHLCRVHRCVNPEHLEVVTIGENVLRGTGVTAQHSRKTHCIKGHEFTEENTYKYGGKDNRRHCRTCRRRRAVEQYYREKEIHINRKAQNDRG